MIIRITLLEIFYCFQKVSFANDFLVEVNLAELYIVRPPHVETNKDKFSPRAITVRYLLENVVCEALVFWLEYQLAPDNIALTLGLLQCNCRCVDPQQL